MTILDGGQVNLSRKFRSNVFCYILLYFRWARINRTDAADDGGQIRCRIRLEINFRILDEWRPDMQKAKRQWQIGRGSSNGETE